MSAAWYVGDCSPVISSQDGHGTSTGNTKLLNWVWINNWNKFNEITENERSGHIRYGFWFISNIQVWTDANKPYRIISAWQVCLPTTLQTECNIALYSAKKRRKKGLLKEGMLCIQSFPVQTMAIPDGAGENTFWKSSQCTADDAELNESMVWLWNDNQAPSIGFNVGHFPFCFLLTEMINTSQAACTPCI